MAGDAFARRMGEIVTCDLSALCLDAQVPLALARFWSGVLGWETSDDHLDGIALQPSDDTGFRLRFLASSQGKEGPNRMHLDLTSTSLQDQQQTVARALALGARHIDIGQLPEEGHVVLADPEGNELCVVGPGNSFLADCGFLGALACDGSQQVGYFWSQALGWPLVWDQDEETAIQSPRGGTKISWGGPPVPPMATRNRLRLDLAPAADSDQLRPGRLPDQRLLYLIAAWVRVRVCPVRRTPRSGRDDGTHGRLATCPRRRASVRRRALARQRSCAGPARRLCRSSRCPYRPPSSRRPWHGRTVRRAAPSGRCRSGRC